MQRGLEQEVNLAFLGFESFSPFTSFFLESPLNQYLGQVTLNLSSRKSKANGIIICVLAAPLGTEILFWRFTKGFNHSESQWAKCEGSDSYFWFFMLCVWLHVITVLICRLHILSFMDAALCFTETPPTTKEEKCGSEIVRVNYVQVEIIFLYKKWICCRVNNNKQSRTVYFTVSLRPLQITQTV